MKESGHGCGRDQGLLISLQRFQKAAAVPSERNKAEEVSLANETLRGWGQGAQKQVTDSCALGPRHQSRAPAPQAARGVDHADRAVASVRGGGRDGESGRRDAWWGEVIRSRCLGLRGVGGDREWN